MGSIIGALGGWISSLMSAPIAPGLTFGSFVIIVFVISGIGLILKNFAGTE